MTQNQLETVGLFEIQTFFKFVVVSTVSSYFQSRHSSKTEANGNQMYKELLARATSQPGTKRFFGP